MLLVSRILAVFFTYRDNSAKLNISQNLLRAIGNLKKKFGLRVQLVQPLNCCTLSTTLCQSDASFYLVHQIFSSEIILKTGISDFVHLKHECCK